MVHPAEVGCEQGVRVRERHRTVPHAEHLALTILVP